MKKRQILVLALAASLLLCACGEEKTESTAPPEVEAVKIESIILSKNEAELKEGESVTLSAVVAPENTTESYRWKSADESVATVDENGVVTADSMTARGYGVGKRTHFALFRFRAEDAAVIAAVLALGAVTVLGIARGAVGFEWYPAIKASPAGGSMSVGGIPGMV